MTAPGYLLYARNDHLADYTNDVPKLCAVLGNCIQKILVPIPTFNHIDFLIGTSAPADIYRTVLKIFSKY